MVSTEKFYETLVNHGIGFFTGVPDSLLSNLCACITDKATDDNHVTAANEGGAIAAAAGYHLATGKYGLVYMQNSGLGNTVNPLISLADPLVYKIPMLLVIGWRGEEGVPDEPQHKKQGLITIGLLETMGIPYLILSDDDESAEAEVKRAHETVAKEGRAFAIIVRKGTFSSYEKKTTDGSGFSLTREGALEIVIGSMSESAVTVSTTGKLSREAFELREKKGEGHSRDFLTVGSMGHASQIALGIALVKPKREIFCLDGDGAAIMHLGGWGIIGQYGPKNFTHILFNNEVHDSVGGQNTAASTMDFVAIAKACGYKEALLATTEEELRDALAKLDKIDGPKFLEIKVKPGSREKLGRPTTTPIQNKDAFMEFLRKG